VSVSFIRNLLIVYSIIVLTSLSLQAQLGEGVISAYYFSGNANDTVNKLNGSVRGATLTTDRFGNPQSAYQFNGQNNLINLGTTSALKQNEMSISLWFKANSFNINTSNLPYIPLVFTKMLETSESYESYLIAIIRSSRKIGTCNTNISQFQLGLQALDSVQLNTWYHVVFSFGKDSSVLHVNGRLIVKQAKKFDQYYLQSDSVVLGYAGNPDPSPKFSWFNGCMDDVKFYNRRLTTSEIITLYKEPNPKLGTPLINQKKKIDWISVLKEYWYISIGALLLITLVALFFRYRTTQLLKRNKEKNELQKKFMQMEMKALRSQMNPHFIFNAITSIQMYVLNSEKELANKYLVKFSKLIRSVLELSKEELIDLKDELEMIKLYVDIESLRFEEQFNFSINNTSINTKRLIPPLIIQPFVENAIWHGLLLKQGEKYLTINVFYKNDALQIEIEDNGIGRKAAEQYSQRDNKHKSLGMTITANRLKVLEQMYNISAWVEIIDKTSATNEAQGTKVIIHLKSKKI
jgi:hypothetical protein